MNRKIILGVATVMLLNACAPAHQQAKTAHPRGFDAMGHGLEQLVLSPFVIVAGLLEGIAMLPYYVAQDLHALNHALVQHQAPVDLERTYQYAYGQALTENAGGGRAFKRMAEATMHFQDVLKGYGVKHHRNYILTAVRSADDAGYTLCALVHRNQSAINVRVSEGGTRTLTRADPEFFRPYRSDTQGRPIDIVIDWAAVPRHAITNQKAQAILMTLGANSVLQDRRSAEYWHAEQRWYAGQHKSVVARRQRSLDARLAGQTPHRG